MTPLKSVSVFHSIKLKLFSGSVGPFVHVSNSVDCIYKSRIRGKGQMENCLNMLRWIGLCSFGFSHIFFHTLIAINWIRFCGCGHFNNEKAKIVPRAFRTAIFCWQRKNCQGVKFQTFFSSHFIAHCPNIKNYSLAILSQNFMTYKKVQRNIEKQFSGFVLS